MFCFYIDEYLAHMDRNNFYFLAFLIMYICKFVHGWSLLLYVHCPVPPKLRPVSESPLVFRTGSNVTLEVAIFDADPQVASSDITWIPGGRVKTFNGSHASATFTDVSPRNTSEVIVVVSHPAGNQTHTFHLTILG